jgi:hypothetical protein
MFDHPQSCGILSKLWGINERFLRQGLCGSKQNCASLQVDALHDFRRSSRCGQVATVDLAAGGGVMVVVMTSKSWASGRGTPSAVAGERTSMRERVELAQRMCGEARRTACKACMWSNCAQPRKPNSGGFCFNSKKFQMNILRKECLTRSDDVN